ncbi:MAG: anti-sigma factor antagonist [Lachnospiraceae bacterium]|nr:anti-sigma factor antagonist [Lachnospiraceae bacterium]
MLLKNEQTDNGTIITISGSIDATTAPNLREEIAKIPDDESKVTLDFKDVEYLSSAGLREILICRQRFDGDRMKIVNVNPDVYDVFKITGFHTMIPMEVTYDEVATYVHLSFKDFLKKKVQNTPDATALVDNRGAFTWEDVDIYSQIIADGLAAKGVKKGTHVGLCGSNSVNWVLTFFAIQKLGAMAQLLNFNMNASEIARVASIGDITHLCYGQMPEMKDEEAFIEELEAADSPLEVFISVRNDRQDIRERRSEYKAIRDKYQDLVREDDPCVMIFTSGSTGVPKGVILSAYNILNAANINYKDQTLKDNDRTCLILPLFHIFGLVAGLFANAMAGSTVIFPDDIRTGTLISLIEKEKCTVFHSVPTMLIAMMNNKDFTPGKLSTLRCTIISGAGATEAQIRMFKEKLPNDHFLASYGLSEMAPVSITKYDDTEEHLLNTVGKPVENISIKICDMSTGKECPTGESGEVLVQGFNQMIGYYKVSLDKQAIDTEGWLHTGDLGMIDEDGYLRLSGRLKELIIRGGENIMPGEVEAAVSQLDIIDNVKVIGIPSDFFGEEVGACIKLKDGVSFDEDAVKSELSKSLSKFKIPSRFFVYDEFPMLGTGKIDGVSLKADVLKRIEESDQ